MNRLMVVSMAVFLFACQSEREESVTGKWFMHKVIQEGRDVTAEHDPYEERFVVFNEDSTFISDGRPFGKNGGKFSIDSEGTLFLDSDQGEQDDSYWTVKFDADTMIWQGVGTEWAENFQLIQVRAKE